VRAVRIASVLVALLAVAVAVAVTQQRAKTRVISAVITSPAPQLGPEAHVLLPNLSDAVVVVPDRPHDPSELHDPEARAKITRLRTFTVSTSSQALRSPEVGPKDGPRVLCVGDSVTFGWGVPAASAYPALLSERLGVEVVNAGVPAMKPSSIAAWVAQHAAALEPDLVLFARRPDYSRPDPWGDYAQALQRIHASLGGVPLGVILPPVSTFDPRGVSTLAEEQRRAAELAAPAPVLDLTPAFRAALPLPGVVLRSRGGQQEMVRQPEGTVIARGPAPPVRPGQPALAPEITAAFEADAAVREPLFFDGGHPDVRGFVIFADAVHDWVVAEGLLSTE